MMYSEYQIIKEHSEMKRNKSLGILKGETPSSYLHPIHPGIQSHFMVIFTHVLTMDIKHEIAGDITRVLIEGFIIVLEVDFLVDKTTSHMPMIARITTLLLHY